MPQARDPHTGQFAPGGGPQPRGGRGWKTTGTKKKTDKGKATKATKAVRNRVRRADQAAGEKGLKVARKIIRKVVKKADQEIQNDPFLGKRRT